jgi:UbiD family decarboxylase
VGYDDLRSWLAEMDSAGELKTIEGAHWDKEIGAICDIMAERNGPALLFDKIPDYPAGFRVLGDAFLSNKRTASLLGIPGNLSSVQMVDAWRKRLKEARPLPPVVVDSGPVFENTLTGPDVDLYKFPTPIWHEHDKGRFIGTGCAVVTKDPDNGWVNLGTYRCQIFDKNHVGVGLNPGKHGTQMMEKFHKQGKAFPVAIVCGMDPVLFMAACSPLTGWDESEYDFAGWVKGEPVRVTPGKTTGLPIPATAEIVLEGEIPAPPQFEKKVDGPFGEWRRTYNAGNHPVMVVKSVSYRNNPIMLGVLPQAMHIPEYFTIPLLASEMWNVLEYAGIPDVTGVWFGLGLVWPVFCVISIKQSYSGHAKQTALVAAGSRANTVGGLFVVVVDDDIDITNEKDVIWAITQRADIDSIEVISGILTKASGPKKRPAPGEQPVLVNDRIIIDACWPYERRDKFPVIHRFSQQYQQQIMNKFKSLF